MKTVIEKAKTTNSLHLCSLNLDFVFPEIYKMVNLARLDLSDNNIVKLLPEIGNLVNLKQLWLCNNPLWEIPKELSKCVKLKELDLRKTFVISLPREFADLQHLTYLRLDDCPMKETLSQTYSSGMASVHSEFIRKNWRKIYKVSFNDFRKNFSKTSQSGNILLRTRKKSLISLKRFSII